MERIRKFAQLQDEISKYGSYDNFKTYIGSMDIETTGLCKVRNTLTVAGIYSRNTPRVYINGKDLEKAKDDIESHDYVVTFNGDRFDIPFLQHKIGLEHNFISIDMMYLLREIGLKGGLKKIESELGITRHSDVVNTTGLDAVRLWKQHLRGDERALDKLVKYNIEDIINLEVLLNYVYFRGENYPVSRNHIQYWKQDIMENLHL